MGRTVLAGAGVVRDLVDAFAEAVRRYPHRPAIIHNGSPLSYRDLDARVRATAQALGPAPGVVGVHTSHTPGTVVGLLGVLAAGGTYCPIDPAYPVTRQDTMLTVPGIRTVLATGPIPSVPPGVAVLRLPEKGPEPEPFTVIDTDAPAYLLFTSGSTGDPKPVVTPRAAVAITVAAVRGLFGITSADRVLQFASLSWDTCFEEILPTLVSGAALVFDDEAYTGSFPRFLRLVERESISVLDLPTAYWHELVRYLAEDDTQLPECLRLVIIGGEAASAARVKDWHALRTGGIRLLNTYGCTETTLITHAADLDGSRAGVPIGLPLPHVWERISDDGELLIGGPALALGYLGRPDDTQARFVELHDGRYFRTGDRVRRARDGLLFHDGRLDHEIKIRGIRVDPAEVEAQLTQHPSVTAVAVTAVVRAGQPTLVAYVVAAGHDDLRDWLRERVPAHLVPSRITVVPDLVSTASGKIDRAATHRRYDPKEAVQ
ncbi:amino acid adenylation domain-containing protein [Micromonospora sp. RTP1Z1]|uniref:amino acid adenylation domain-containing protein n=1 Tax=Micromonospora sp. RTP1Z1 TaxID=2994043 RepID=UPI0029C87731|nr:amino acid adenylation domain-containing protein [Micromonospora sp. RTP1Z1]